jgi:hypothetical protein
VGEMSLVEKERKKTLFIFFRRKLYGVFETESAALEAIHTSGSFFLLFFFHLFYGRQSESQKRIEMSAMGYTMRISKHRAGSLSYKIGEP